MTTPRRPIGYWLKHLDGLIEDHFQQALAVEGVDRRQWQLLNTLAAAPADRQQLAAAVAPFLSDDPDGAARALAALLTRGWLEEHDGRFSMTPAGAAAHRRLRDRASSSRASILAGITPEQYRSVVATLEQMAANLSGATPRGPGR